MMFCVGLTGNIGSGKSTVLSLFGKLGVEVASADSLARALTQPGNTCFEAICDRFGETILTENGELNRPLLRQILSKSQEEKAWLESLLHPKIRQSLATIVANAKGPYAMLEIPLLFSLEHYPYIQRVLLVSSPKARQIARIVRRDKTNAERARALIALQPSIKERRKLADDEIVNDGDLLHLQNQVEHLHAIYLQMAAKN